jgi:hypothetical protein
MNKKWITFTITLLAGVLLVFGLAGCGSNADPSNPGELAKQGGPSNPGTGDPVPGPREKIGEGSGWPSAKLPDYNHASWTQPEGLNGISWEEFKAGSGAMVLYFFDIKFTSATAATKNSIDDYLEP